MLKLKSWLLDTISLRIVVSKHNFSSNIISSIFFKTHLSITIVFRNHDFGLKSWLPTMILPYINFYTGYDRQNKDSFTQPKIVVANHDLSLSRNKV